MSAINGTLYAIFSTTGIISTASASTDRIYSCKTASLNVNVDLPDATTKESAAWAEHITGLRDASIDFGGVWDEAGSATALTATEIMTLIIAGNATRKFAFVPAALGTTIPGWKFMGNFSKMGITADVEKPCEFSGSVKATGALVLFDA
jgi:hypothetical protein